MDIVSKVMLKCLLIHLQPIGNTKWVWRGCIYKGLQMYEQHLMLGLGSMLESYRNQIFSRCCLFAILNILIKIWDEWTHVMPKVDGQAYIHYGIFVCTNFCVIKLSSHDKQASGNSKIIFCDCQEFFINHFFYLCGINHNEVSITPLMLKQTKLFKYVYNVYLMQYPSLKNCMFKF